MHFSLPDAEKNLTKYHDLFLCQVDFQDEKEVTTAAA